MELIIAGMVLLSAAIHPVWNLFLKQEPDTQLGYLGMTVVLTACGAAEQRGAKPSADWSRGAPLGGDSSGSVGLALGNEGASVRLVWPVGAGKSEIW